MAVAYKPLLVLLAVFLLPVQAFADEPNPDPFESWNRKVFTFNDWADRYMLRPVAVGYTKVTPDPVERGISRMFSNIGEVPTVLNSLLQGKPSRAANSTGRFLVNSTVGLLGFFDVARHVGLEKAEGEDFGQTLGRWGVPSGPYVVLPLLGSSTLRDAPSLLVDMYANPIYYMEDEGARLGVVAVGVVSTRANLLDAETLISGDRYLFIRDVYLQRREFLVRDGEVEDDFGDFDDYY